MSTFLQKLKKNQTESDLVKAELKKREERNPEEADVSVPVLVDMSLSGGEVIVVAHIPGVSKKTVKVKLEGENDILTIEGENRPPENWRKSINSGKKWEDPVKAGLAVKTGGIRECKYGSFFRKIVLPEEVEFKSKFVKIKDGVIEVSLPLYNPAK